MPLNKETRPKRKKSEFKPVVVLERDGLCQAIPAQDKLMNHNPLSKPDYRIDDELSHIKIKSIRHNL